MKAIEIQLPLLASVLAFSILSCQQRPCEVKHAVAHGAAPSPAAVSTARPPELKSKIPSAEVPIELRITGLVKRSFQISREDLKDYPSVEVRLNDVHRDGSFHGVHLYRGVPLRLLLDQAEITKGESKFNKAIDLSVAVKSRSGKQVVLSWGEIFYRDAAEVIIAYDSSPKMPHKHCSSCHAPAVYQPFLEQMERQVGFPKLVVTRDLWTDRAIEEIAEIEVAYLGKETGLYLEKKEERPAELNAESINISRPGLEPVVIEKLPTTDKRYAASVVQAGDGTGFHGIKHFEGVPLGEVLLQAGIRPDPGAVYICSAPDGYRVAFSSGEIFSDRLGTSVLLADKLNGTQLREGGRFRIIPIYDQAADRWLKSVSRIDIVPSSVP